MGANTCHQKSSGVTLFWDARIPFQDTHREPNGRLAAVTLMGPNRPTLRVIALYGVSNPIFHQAEAPELKLQLELQLQYAKDNRLTALVLGDVNEHPWSDKKFPRNIT